jgi:glycosyltransferase involved in cell wall biosynthesis
MKIFASCVTKNEVDIIEECLKAASQWADRIFVFDNGSTDGTWEKVQAMSSDVIVPWKQDGKVFQESLRAEPFNDRRSEARDGDWWCRLDTDEFYIDNPKEFLAAIPRWQHVVWAIAIEYYLTHDELDRIDFSAPAAQILPQLRHYHAKNSEPRFFRYRERLVWNENEGWPRHIGIPTEPRIRYKHYKYRSPDQIQKRIDTRKDSIQRGFAARSHYVSTSWRDEIADAATLDLDAGDGNYHIRYEELPRHIDSPARTLAKRIMHGTGLWP